MAIGGLKPTVLVGAPMLCLGVLLHIVGLATPAWSIVSDDLQAIEYGPWRICVAGGGIAQCFSTVIQDCTGPICSKYQAVQAMTLLGAMAGAVAAGLAILTVARAVSGKDGIKNVPLITMGASAASCVFAIIGVIVWAATIQPDIAELSIQGYSFYLSLVGGVFVVAGGALVFGGTRGA